MSSSNRPLDERRPFDLVCMGRVAVDLYAEQIHSPLENAQSFRKYLGGCAGNISVGTSRLGLKSAMFSCTGTDAMGEFLRQQLHHEGVDTTLLRDTSEHLTALVLLGVSPPDRFPLIFYRENCADMQIRPEDADPAFLRKAKALLFTGTCLSSPSMKVATQAAVKTAKEQGCAVILDIDYRPVLWGLTAAGDGESRFVASEAVTKELQPLLKDLDLIIGTEEEVMIAGGTETLEDALQVIRDSSNATVVLKRGEKGCEVFEPGSQQSRTARPFPIKVLNVLGAGDAFASGFLRGWLRGETLETCALWGNANGALTVTRHGCAPSMASFEELQYLIENFDSDPNILTNSRLLRLHQRTILGKPRNYPLQVLAFDHRTQFEDSCKQHNQPTSRITEFKSLVFEGFKKVATERPDLPLALLVDPQYGADILQDSAYASYSVGAPIEQAGSYPVEWLCGEELHEHLLSRPSEWFIKVLWHYHTDLPAAEKERQLIQLKRLEEICQLLDRRLMLELILPAHLSQDGNAMAAAIDEVYEAQITPFWWKIMALDTKMEWQHVTDALDRHDSEAGIIVLGKNAPLETFPAWFKTLRSTPHTCGFAIGRSIFWKPWESFISGSMAPDEIPSIIEKNYVAVLEMWEAAGTVSS
ncbi:MAG: 5-dehydro-2-deoxygluconokinase [SAR324 cluster bacterium]|nr:5-dehydro-2-deoxygluconokinase [SAR324 cluster bacterium]